MTIKLSPAAGLSLSFAATFACVGVGLPYGSVWMADRGLSVVEIGYLSSLGSLAKLIASGPFGNIADRLGRPGLMVLTGVAVALLGHTGYLLAGAFWQYALIALMVGMFFPGALSVLESVASRQAAQGHFDYGRVRLWGSVGFLATSLLVGALLRWLDPWIIMPAMVACLALALAVTLAAPIRDSGDPPPPRASLWRHALTVLKAPGVAWVFLAAGCIQNSHMMYYSYSVLHWRNVGMESTLTGALWGLSIIGEIGLMMIAGGWLMRIGPSGLMLAGGLSASIRWALMAMTSDPWVMILCQLLHAPSFTLTHLATMRFFGERAPPGLAATTQGLFMALPMGLATMAAFASSGLLYQAFGGGGFWAMSLLAIVGSLACLKLRV